MTGTDESTFLGVYATCIIVTAMVILVSVIFFFFEADSLIDCLNSKQIGKNEFSKVVENIWEIPRDDLSGEYNYSTVEVSNILGLHRVQMSFEMDYHDWSIFLESETYHHLIEYLEELQKQETLR